TVVVISYSVCFTFLTFVYIIYINHSNLLLHYYPTRRSSDLKFIKAKRLLIAKSKNAMFLSLVFIVPTIYKLSGMFNSLIPLIGRESFTEYPLSKVRIVSPNISAILPRFNSSITNRYLL